MPELRHSRKFPLLVLLAVVSSGAVHGANVSVPSLELSTWGRVDGGAFGLFSRAYMEILLEGGYKFGGRAEFAFEDDSLEEPRTLPPVYDADGVETALRKNLYFKSIGVEIRRIFDSPLNLVYFSGTTDVFASGTAFSRRFGADDFSSSVKGYGYFPTGIEYDGIHTVRGTGMKIHAPGFSDRFDMALYTYQDEYFSRGRYSSDFRFLFNADTLKIETFIGATYPNSAYGQYRGGLMFFYSTGLGGEFFTQIGVPRWDPETDADFTIDLFYLLFEPRVRVDLFSVILTFFWHPQYYEQTETNEAGTLDFFVKFMYGDVQKTRLSGGVENRLTLQTRAGDQYSFRISPFLAVVTSGVVWDLKISLQVQPYELDELVQTYFGIKTQL